MERVQHGDRADHRRAFLKKAVLAGGAAWVAPTILVEHSGAQVGTCNFPGTVSWAGRQSVANRIYSDSGGSLNFTQSTGPALTLTFAVTAATSGGTTYPSSAQVVNQPAQPGGATRRQGGFDNYFLVTVGQDGWPEAADGVGKPAGTQRTITLTFTKPVRNVIFTIADVDYSAAYRDQVQVTPTPNGFTLGPAGVCSVCTGSPTTCVEAVGSAPQDTFRGRATAASGGSQYCNANADGTGGNVRVVLHGPLTVVTIAYTALNAIPAGQDQKIGISDISYCTSP